MGQVLALLDPLLTSFDQQAIGRNQRSFLPPALHHQPVARNDELLLSGLAGELPLFQQDAGVLEGEATILAVKDA